MTHPDSSLVERVARAWYDLTLHETSRTWQSLAETEQDDYLGATKTYLRATSEAGAVLLDANPHSGQISSAHRLTATVRGTDNRPLERDIYASYLQERIDVSLGTPRRSLLTYDEAATVAALLDELAGTYAAEPLGQLAHHLARQINHRLGI